MVGIRRGAGRGLKGIGLGGAEASPRQGRHSRAWGGGARGRERGCGGEGGTEERRGELLGGGLRHRRMATKEAFGGSSSSGSGSSGAASPAPGSRRRRRREETKLSAGGILPANADARLISLTNSRVPARRPSRRGHLSAPRPWGRRRGSRWRAGAEGGFWGRDRRGAVVGWEIDEAEAEEMPRVGGLVVLWRRPQPGGG